MRINGKNLPYKGKERSLFVINHHGISTFWRLWWGKVKSMFEHIYHLFHIIMFNLRVWPKKKSLPIRSGFSKSSPTYSLLHTARPLATTFRHRRVFSLKYFNIIQWNSFFVVLVHQLLCLYLFKLTNFVRKINARFTNVCTLLIHNIVHRILTFFRDKDKISITPT